MPATRGSVRRAARGFRRYGRLMTLAADGDANKRGATRGEFAIGDLSTGIHASGFGDIGDGRSFSFRIEHRVLIVEVYHPRLRGPVPAPEDVVASSRRSLVDIDLSDERSLAAAVRDAVAAARPVARRTR